VSALPTWDDHEQIEIEPPNFTKKSIESRGRKTDAVSTTAIPTADGVITRQFYTGARTPAGRSSIRTLPPERLKSQSTTKLWIKMTKAVNTTRKRIDDAISLHAENISRQQLVEEQRGLWVEERHRLKKAQDQRHIEEMSALINQSKDPLFRSALASELVATEPPRRVIDRVKHPEFVGGVLLAEATQQTAALIQEGLKRLDYTFSKSRRRKV
jgi:hypothetical protein